jgi:sphingomyelin phosphodiesterase
VRGPAEAAGYWGDYRKCDTPLRTIEAMYRHIASHHQVDLIYWTGDLPPHDIWNQTRAGNVEVVRATARQLREHFPGVPVLPALGNHESVPVDSFPPPEVGGDLGMAWLYSALQVLQCFCV